MFAAVLFASLTSAPVLAKDEPVDPLFGDDGPEIASVRRAHVIGLGLGAGTSTAGLSAKYWANESLAFQAVVGAGYRRRDDQTTGLVETDRSRWATGFAAGADLLFEQPSFAQLDEVELGWSVGPGLGVWVEDEAALAVAGVAGLELGLLAIPVDVVVEYRPRVQVVPELAFDWFSLSGHIRWYFGGRRS